MNDKNTTFKPFFSVFSVEDKGNGIAKGQLSRSKKPYANSTRDKALVDKGAVDNHGYIRGSFFVTFMGRAYDKAVSLSNGAVITDVTFDFDAFPFVNKSGELQYRKEPQIQVIDFEVREKNNNFTNSTETTTAQTTQPKYEEPEY